MVHRTFPGFALALALVGASVASAQEGSLTADEAVARVLASPALDTRLEGALEQARGELGTATLQPTPSLSLSYSQVPVNSGDLIEFSAQIQQRLDLTPWRSRLADALPHREASLRAQSDVWRLDVATRVRESFYAVRMHEERLSALDAWVTHLERGVEAIAARQARGDASVLERRRVERELELARAARGREDSALAESWDALEAWLPMTSRPRLRGDLSPPSTLTHKESSPPQLTRLEQDKLAIEAEFEAWGSPSLRGWILGGGYRYVDEGELSGHGFVLSLSLPLALWNNDETRLARLRGASMRLDGELELARGQVERAERAARARLSRTLQTLEALSSRAEDAELTTLTEAAWRAGEASLLELLDAYQSEAELSLARIDLQWEARRASIALDYKRGLGSVPSPAPGDRP